jgi:hypothetical protein
MRTVPSRLTGSDEQLRRQYLREVLELLYPEPAEADATAATEPYAELLLIPDAHSPRLLVPAESRRLAAAAVRRYSEPQSRIARLKRGAVVAALHTGVSHAVLRDRVTVYAGPDSVEAYLRDHLGPNLVPSIHIGPARANRKPVLQLLGVEGATVGFAKLGNAPLTDRLVRAETLALSRLGHTGLDGVSVARVLHQGEFRGHPILVQSALPVWTRRGRADPNRLATAMAGVAEVFGTHVAALRTSAYWAELRQRLDAVAVRPDGRTLAHAAQTLVAGAGDNVLTFGSWHGDWSPWNMATLPHTLLVWDWERFAIGVPLGFDALHHLLQCRLQEGGFGTTVDAAAVLEECVSEATATLKPFGVKDHKTAHLTALLHLIDLATRYLEDRQAEAGARLGALGTWLLPVLVRRVATIEAAAQRFPRSAGAQ